MIVLGVIEMDPLLFGRDQQSPGGEPSAEEQKKFSADVDQRLGLCPVNFGEKEQDEEVAMPQADLLVTDAVAESMDLMSDDQPAPVMIVPGPPSDLLDMGTPEFASDG